MPKLISRPPAYRRHKASGQAVVTLSGKDHYLGPWRSKASKDQYDQLISEWLSGGRRPLESDPDVGLTVTEVAARYLDWAEGYYLKDGQPTRTIERVKLAIRWLRTSYGRTAAAEFGPRLLRAVQSRMVAEGKSRPYVNDLIEEIRRLFKWCVSHELVSPSIYQALATVPGLKKGRTPATRAAASSSSRRCHDRSHAAGPACRRR